jgi:hypothetical protein
METFDHVHAALILGSYITVPEVTLQWDKHFLKNPAIYL